MRTVEDLLAAYIAEHQAGGEADPPVFLAQAAPAERPELAAMIDTYLARAPRQPFDPAAYERSSSPDIVEKVERVIGGNAGLWPALLPRLRHQAQIKRSDLVRQLAEILGLADRQPKVAGYYNQMEQGTLQADRVSTRVLDALGHLLGETAEHLREAGRAAGPGLHPTGAVFARATQAGRPLAAPAPAPPPEGWDEVDELFQGGQ